MAFYLNGFTPGDPEETEKSFQRAEERWQRERERERHTQLMAVYKIRGDIADKFAEACGRAGVDQSAKITELMVQFIREQSQQ